VCQTIALSSIAPEASLDFVNHSPCFGREIKWLLRTGEWLDFANYSKLAKYLLLFVSQVELRI
jgi:hypothetical protein